MKVTETRASREPDRYRIVRVNFRPGGRWWLDLAVVSLAIVVVLLAWFLRGG